MATENKGHSEHAVNSVTGVFLTNEDANKVYDTLLANGYSQEQISVVMSEETQSKNYHMAPQDNQKDETGETRSAETATMGAAIGGTTGAVISAVAALGTNLVLPGIGLALAGPVLAGLAGAAAGGVAGGTIGSIVGSGFPKENEEYYETSVKEGAVIISVHPSNEMDKEAIISLFNQHNGQKIYVRDDQAA
ncbi:hypothetical protein GCM10027275_26830 [Rhabdobacter roseus]|uniref:General stress protein 17M-like domain-containing protein n=1 Tax=Rhabdobacter roseus TaxID=1655419 RepID=A0A840TXH9_9BACT|nr:hypothetical protein [Rhabdobacter roseus]MBB5284630.1 hypothetical protein [Rhabdobacter roseus]